MHTPRRPALTRRQLSRLLAAVVCVGTLGASMVACSDQRPSPTALATTAGEPTTPGGEAAQSIAAHRLPDSTYAWVGREHNRAVASLARRLLERRDLVNDHRQFCEALLGELTQYFSNGHTRDDRGLGVTFSPITMQRGLDAGRLATGCDDGTHGPRPSGVAGFGHWVHSVMSPPSDLSPETYAVLDQIDAAIELAPSAADFQSRALAIAPLALTLPNPEDRAAVHSAIALGLASAAHADSLHGWNEAEVPPGPPPGNFNPMWAPGGRARAKAIVQDDLSGCVGGAVVGIFGGPTGVVAGCYLAGVSGSVAAIVKSYMQ